MVCSSLYILDLKGKVILGRDYRGDVPPKAVDRFVPLVLESEDENLSPVISENGLTFIYIRHNNIYFLGITRKNSNACAIVVFLHKLKQTFEVYFKEVVEESIRDNFVVVYELLDEMMDFGYVQITEPKILKEYITQESHKMEISTRPPMAVTNAVSWRSEGLKYRRNDAFLDVVESMTLLMNSNGSVLRSEILGNIKMRCYLSGMPELRLGLNDKVVFESGNRQSAARGKGIELDDVKFHQCVRLSRFENDRTISFIPPDGEFDLMSYRLNTQIKPLIHVESMIELYPASRVEYIVKARSQFKQKSTANNVQILIPVPEDADSPTFKCTAGHAKYAPEINCMVWTIRQLAGGRECVLRAHFGLPTLASETEIDTLKQPIQVKFEIPYFTVSGIQVRYLKIIEKSGYQAFPWVRYITKNGDYHVRLPDVIVPSKNSAR